MSYEEKIKACFNSGYLGKAKDYGREADLEIAALIEWQRKAFQCYPNIDLDIETKRNLSDDQK